MYISSDSDEDQPVLQKLQKIKNKIRAQIEPVVPTTNVNNCNDSIDLSDLSSFEIPPSKSDEVIEVPDIDKNYDSTRLFLDDSVVCETEDVTNLGAETRGRGAKRGRGRGRGRGRKSGRRNGQIEATQVVAPPTPSLPDNPTPVDNQRIGTRRSTRSTVTNLQPSPVGYQLSTPRRGTRGARGSRSRRRGRSPRYSQSPRYPIYSIGNTDDYPDASSNQQLFTKTLSDSSIIDLNESLDNEELSVKVFWQSREVIKFNIRKLQKLKQIFDHFAKQECVEHNQLLFTYNNKILRHDDTPESISYNIATFIEGGIIDSGLLPTVQIQKSAPKGFLLKFQCQTLKKPFELSISKDERLQLAMIKCAEHLELPVASLRFEFDGEAVKGNMTPKDLEMESGDCIDVKILNVNK